MLLQGPHAGALFETLVYSDFIKRTASDGEVPEHYYLQTKSKAGVDFIVKKNQKLDLFEVKFTETFQSRLCDQLSITAETLKNINSLNLLMPIEKSFETKISGHAVHVKNWAQMI
jgi:predicted AAA+ superfamily ATPase